MTFSIFSLTQTRMQAQCTPQYGSKVIRLKSAEKNSDQEKEGKKEIRIMS